MFGLIIGLLSAIIPQGLKFWQDKKDKEHELKLLGLQMQAQTQGHIQRLEEINAEADVKESEAVYKAYQPVSEYPKTGNKWVDGIGAIMVIGINIFNSSVRPAVAYWIVGLYAYLKVNMPKLEWTPTDTEILFLVLGHFFGNRAMKYVFKK